MSDLRGRRHAPCVMVSAMERNPSRPLAVALMALALTASASIAAQKTGTNGADKIVGGSGADRIAGLRGNDRLYGRAGNDTIFGDSGNDSLSGGAGADTLLGGSGKDRISTGAGRDVVAAGDGKDFIRARDHARDDIDCGAARDRVEADGIDKVSGNCEVVRRG